MSDSASVDPLIGTEFAGYRVETVLRRDESGESLLCRTPANAARVVVRTVACARGSAGRERVRIERVCDQLGQPADDTLVPIRECRTEPDRLVVVRDWVDGSDLRTAGGEDGTLSLVVALEVVSQVARSLDAARWAHGVVHGNLKPQNILLEPRSDGRIPERVWVVDFGFWPPFGASSKPGRTERAHRSAYLAPELVGGEEPTASSDQYALACLLYECLSGQPPFGGTESARSDARTEERPASIRECWPEVPEAVDEAIGRALARQPEDRFTSSSEFAGALKAKPMAGVPPSPSGSYRSQPSESNSGSEVRPPVEPEHGPAGAAHDEGLPQPGRVRRGLSRRLAVSALAVAVIALAAVAVVVLVVAVDRNGPASDAAESFTSGGDLNATAAESANGASGAALSWVRASGDNGVFGADGNQDIRSIIRGGPGLVAVGLDGSTAAVWTSVDGATWSRAPHDEAVFGGERFQRMLSVTAGPTGLVAVGSDGTDAAVWRSADGLVWSRVTHGDPAVLGGAGTQGMRAVALGGPGLVAVGFDTARAGIDAAAWTSVDGSAWTRVSHDDAVFGLEGNQTMRSVTAGGPGLVAVGSDGTDGAVWTSVDGATWIRVPDPDRVLGPEGNQEIRSVTAGGPGLVAVGLDAVDAEVWTSVDGATWNTVPEDVAAAVFGATDSPGARMNSVIAGGPGLVAAGFQTGVGAAIWTSADGLTWLRVPDDGEALGAGGGELMTSVTVSGSALIAVGRNGTDAAVWTSGGSLAPLQRGEPELRGTEAPVEITNSDVENRAGGQERQGELSFGSVASVDPRTGRITAMIDTDVEGGSSIRVAVGETSLWTIERGGHILTQIDARTNTVTRTVEIAGEASDLAIGAGSVWIASSLGREGVLVEVSADTGRFRRVLGLGFPGAASVAVGNHAIWVAVGGEQGNLVLRVDPATGEVVAATPVSNQPRDIAVADNGVWLVGGQTESPQQRPGTVWRIDPNTNQVVGTGLLPGNASAVATDAGRVWVVDVIGEDVLEIDPETNGVARVIAVGPGYVDVAAAQGSVWVVSGRQGELKRIDTLANEVVDTIDLAGACACSVGVGGAGIWIG